MAIVKASLKSDAAGKDARWYVSVLLLFLPLAVSRATDVVGGRWIDVTVTSVAVCTTPICRVKGSVIIGLSAEAGGSPPACSGGYREHVALDISTAAGAFAAQLFQHSAAAGSKLMISGTGTCVDPGIETLGTVSELISATRSTSSP